MQIKTSMELAGQNLLNVLNPEHNYAPTVGLLPMILGAGLGATCTRRASAQNHPAARKAGRMLTILRWTQAALTTLALAALAVLLAVPASTPPILGADGKPLPGSIAELATVHIGGHNQIMLIRGYSVDNPVLLSLSGGPGQSDMPFRSRKS